MIHSLGLGFCARTNRSFRQVINLTIIGIEQSREYQEISSRCSQRKKSCAPLRIQDK